MTGQHQDGWGGFEGPDTQPAPTAPPPPAWHQLPPEQLARLHQPGIIPLRPLTLGDIFAGSLQTMRRNPGATIGLAIVVLAILLVPSLLVSLAIVQSLSWAETDELAMTTLASTLFSMLASVTLTGAIVHVVGEAVLGDRASSAETWAAIRSRIPALLANLLIVSGLVIAGTAALIAVGAGLVAFADDGAAGIAAVVLLVLLLLASVVLLVWAGCRLSLAPAAVVLEKAGPWQGVRRAWALTRGGQAWRVAGITLLSGLLASLFTSAISVPLTLASAFLLDASGTAAAATSPAWLVVDHLTTLLVSALATPFTAGVLALLYLDQRIRREGLDVNLVQAAQERAAARSR